MKFDKTNIDQHILRFLDKTASEEEQAGLLEWVKQDPANKQYYIEQVNLFKQLNAQKLTVDTNAAFQKVRSAQPKPDFGNASVAQSAFIAPVVKLAAVAVAVTVIIASAFFIFFDPEEVGMDEDFHELQYLADDTILEVKLPDSSDLVLNKNSRAVFKQDDTSRVLSIYGKAYLNVFADSLRPFYIWQNGMYAKTQGRQLSVEADSARNNTVFTVIDGFVKVYDSVSNTTFTVSSKETYKQESQEAGVKMKLNTANSLAWKTGELHFDNTPLSIAIPEIAAFYDKEIIVADSSIMSCKLNAKLDRYGFKDVLAMFELAFAMDVKTKGDSTILSGNGCN